MKSWSHNLSKIDPRWIVIFNHSSLLLFGIYFLALQRTFIQIGFGFLLTLFAEVACSYLLNKNFSKFEDRIKTAAVISLGLLLFVITRTWWLYGVLGAFAVLGKNMIRDLKGRHIFNPTGFAIVCMLAFFPNYIFIRADQYNGVIWTQLQIIVLGVIVGIIVDRWRMTLSYLATNFILSLILAIFFSKKFLLNFGPDLGAEGLLFMFFMFTDPQTSPTKAAHQFIAGCLIGSLNILYRNLEFAYSQFLAIFTVASLIRPHFDWVEVKALRLKDKIFSLQNKVGWANRSYYGIIVISVFLMVQATSSAFNFLSFPFSDYRMFSARKEYEPVVIYRPYAVYENDSIIEMNQKGVYLGYSFILKNLLNEKKYDILNRQLKRLYHQLRVRGIVAPRAKAVGLLKLNYDPQNSSTMQKEKAYEVLLK